MSAEAILQVYDVPPYLPFLSQGTITRWTAEGGCTYKDDQISRITGMISGRFWLCLEM